MKQLVVTIITFMMVSPMSLAAGLGEGDTVYSKSADKVGVITESQSADGYIIVKYDGDSEEVMENMTAVEKHERQIQEYETAQEIGGAHTSTVKFLFSEYL